MAKWMDGWMDEGDGALDGMKEQCSSGALVSSRGTSRGQRRKFQRGGGLYTRLRRWQRLASSGWQGP